MSINKLVAGAQGDVGNSNGSDIANSVNGLIDAQSTVNTTNTAMALKLAQGEVAAVMLVQGDSTGNADDEWVFLTASEIASQYPNHNFIVSDWNIALDSYLPYRSINEGDLGYARVRLESASDMFGSVEYSAGNFDVDSDLDVRCKCSFDSYSENGEGVILSRFNVGGDRSWALGVNSSGLPYLWWSADGTNLIGPRTGDTPISTPAGSPFYVRATLDVDNGAGGYDLTFYTSSDEGETWAQLGSVFTGAGVTSIHNGSLDIIMNGRGGSNYTGYFYRAEVLNGIGGEMIASPNSALYRDYIDLARFNDLQGNTCTFNSNTGDLTGSPTIILLNASASGKALPYSADLTRFEKQTPIESDVNFISYSHNAGGDPMYPTAYPAFIDQHYAKHPNSVVIPSTQNPKKSPSTDIDIARHAYRCGVVAHIAASRGLNLIDAYGVFLATGDPDSYIDPDGTHPTPQGSQLWSNAALVTLGFNSSS